MSEGTRKRRKRRWPYFLLVVVLLLGGGFLYIRRMADQVAIRYTSVVVQRGDLEVLFSFTGTIHAPNMQTITAGQSASVREVYAEPNSQVTRGDRLVRMDDGTIYRAELAGELTQLQVRPGDYVSAGQTVAVITDMSRMEVEISIDEYDVPAISIGKEVDVKVVAVDESCGGTIVAFNKQGSSGSQLSSYRATVALDAPEHALPGMQVEVTLVKDQVEDALLLPKEALQVAEDNTVSVLVQTGDEVPVSQPVSTGITDGMMVEITGGLTEGQTVVYEGNTNRGMFIYGQGSQYNFRRGETR